MKATTAPIPPTTLSASGAGAAFGLDPQARDDYGYSGDMTLGPIGKAIIAKFYGEAPARSYMFGCSNGGRHAMVAASRMGDQYDGFVAGDPGFDLPRAAIQHAWDVQSFADDRSRHQEVLLAGRHGADRPQGARGLRQARRRRGRHGRRHQGLPEGLPSRRSALRRRQDRSMPLDETQVDGADPRLRRTDTTARASSSIPIGRSTPAWARPTGASGRSFSGIPPWNNNPLIATMGAASLAAIFTTPPTLTKGDPDSLIAFLDSFRFRPATRRKSTPRGPSRSTASRSTIRNRPGSS